MACIIPNIVILSLLFIVATIILKVKINGLSFSLTIQPKRKDHSCKNRAMIHYFKYCQKFMLWNSLKAAEWFCIHIIFLPTSDTSIPSLALFATLRWDLF